MLTINDLRNGVKIEIESQPYIVTAIERSKRARQGAVVKTTMRNLLTGRSQTKTFAGNDKIEEANVSTKEAQFLYHDGDEWHFMENETFEQYHLTTEQIGEAKNYIIDGLEVIVLKYNDQPVSLDLPKKVTLTVTHAEPGIRGDTASGGGTKEIELETGLKIQAPLFVEQGQKVVVNTDTGDYVERG